MKKLFYYHSILLLVITLLASCKKEGPMGPEGPEGPAGNPGANSSGGNGGGTVKVYTSDLALDVFRWTGQGAYYSLERRKAAAPDWFSGFRVPDTAEEIPDAVVLVYLQMQKGTSARAWYNLPYMTGTSATGYERFSANTWYDEDDNSLSVGIAAEVTQLSPTTVTVPSYAVKGIRVVVIPAGTSEETGRAAMPDTNMTFEDVVQRYKVQEKDFRKL